MQHREERVARITSVVDHCVVVRLQIPSYCDAVHLLALQLHMHKPPELNSRSARLAGVRPRPKLCPLLHEIVTGAYMIVVMAELRHGPVRHAATGSRELTLLEQSDCPFICDVPCRSLHSRERGSVGAACLASSNVGHVHRKPMHQLCVAHPHMAWHLSNQATDSHTSETQTEC